MIIAGKYTPLEKYLRDLPGGEREITLSFEQIERILNDRLPPSAYEYWAWWANEKEGNHVNARAWAHLRLRPVQVNAGWKVTALISTGNRLTWFE